MCEGTSCESLSARTYEGCVAMLGTRRPTLDQMPKLTRLGTLSESPDSINDRVGNKTRDVFLLTTLSTHEDDLALMPWHYFR